MNTKEKKVGTASPLFVKSDENFNALVAAVVKAENSDKSKTVRAAIIARAKTLARRHPDLRILITAVEGSAV
jgi:hypothetical protein